MKRRITEKLLESEHERLKQMHEFEEKYDEYSCIYGMDEAGRGPLAGPVVAASVILPKDAEILFLNDSKKVRLLFYKHQRRLKKYRLDMKRSVRLARLT